MFSPRKESTISSTNIGDQLDANEKVGLKFPVDIHLGGALTSKLPHSTSEVHYYEPNSIISSPDEPQVEDIYSIARDEPWRAIRKPTRYATGDDNELIAYALTIAQETYEGIEPNSSN